MNKKLAVQIITEALNLAMTKGCFGLVENTNIVKALDVLNQEGEIISNDLPDKN